MNNTFEFTITDNILIITENGHKDTLSSLIESAIKIDSIANQHALNHIMVDFSETDLKVKMNDTFNIVRVYEHKIPVFKSVKMFGVIKESALDIGKYRQKLSIIRGYNFKVFSDFGKAANLLKNKN